MAATDIVFETGHWAVALSDNQAYLGRAVVMAKAKAASLSELKPDAWNDLLAVISRFEQAVKSAYSADMFNWNCLMNDAYKQATPQPQVHWHVRPRYRVAPKLAGDSYPDPNFAHHYDKTAERVVNRRTIALILMELQRADYAN